MNLLNTNRLADVACMQLGQTRHVFEAQPSDYTLTSSYELCHCSPLAGPSPGRAPVGCPVLLYL